jgi:hypothetical protein
MLIALSYGFNFEINLENVEYRIEKYQGYDRLILTGGRYANPPGAPELPVLASSFSLPAGQYIKSVRISEEKYEELNGRFHIYPQQRSWAIDEIPQFTLPDSAYYNCQNLYPRSTITNYHTGNLRGCRIGRLSYAPFRYNPKTGQLYILTKLSIELETGYRADCFEPWRQTALSREIFERIARSFIGPGPAFFPGRIEGNPEDLRPADLPTLLGPPVDLLIITNDSLAAVFELYARFKKMYGFNSAIRTMNWIRNRYSGFDDAERVRNFIKDAVEKWGVGFVLLGGDVPEVPVRVVRMEPLLQEGPAYIATDLYYSDLDGNWNFDGDEYFGEIEDSLDLYPDVLVGRVTARSDSDVINYLDKVRDYLQPQVFRHYTRSLYVSADWSDSGDARAAASQLATHMPHYFDTLFINEVALQEFKDTLYSDWAIIHILVHGDVNQFRLRTSPRVLVNNFFFDSLAGAGIIHPLMLIVSCYTGPFDRDCLGEHWVMNPHAGGIGYIGPSYSSSAREQMAYNFILSDSILSLPMAGALAYAKIYWIPESHTTNSWCRSYQFSLNLLGDPSITLWDSIPRDLPIPLVVPDTLDLGIDTVTVSLTGRIHFTAVFYKPGEIFLRDSGIGYLRLPVKTKTPGYLDFSVLAPGYKIFRDSIFVRPAGPHLIIAAEQVIDSLNNNNHIVNPGEDIFLRIRLNNTGSDTASGIMARISGSDSFLTYIQDSADFPVIPPGGQGENQTLLHFLVGQGVPDDYAFNFQILLNYGGFSNIDSLQLVAQAPRLMHYTQEFIIAGDTASILPFIQNLGQETADSISILVRAGSDTVQVIDSIARFPDIPPGGIVSSGLDSLLARLAQPGTLRLNLQVLDHGLIKTGHNITLGTPAPTGRIWTTGQTGAITIKWQPVAAAFGYRIFRAPDPGGPYQPVNGEVDPVAYYEDGSIAGDIDYYYYVKTVDSSMNESPPSDTIRARANPRLAPGWPQVMRGYDFSSPNYGDLDPDYPGLEVVVGANDGALYAWHYDGTPVAGNGALLETGSEIWSSPALGDVNRDGVMEIIVGIRFLGSNNLYVLDPRGQPLPHWPQSVEGGVLTSPVLSDIDGDGDLEIFVVSECGVLYAFHHTGEGVFSTSGFMKRLYGGYFGTPAIGDINLDGSPEIVCGGGIHSESLFVWDRFGNYLPPFPAAIDSGMNFSPVLGNVNGDNHLEICFYTKNSNSLYVVDYRGMPLWHRNLLLGDVEASPIIADMAGSPRPEIICGNGPNLCVFDSIGDYLDGYPLDGAEHTWKMPIVADVDDDSLPDIAVGASAWSLFAHHRDGTVSVGFPIPMGHKVECSPAVGDLDGDGGLELMTGDDGFKFYVFKLRSKIWSWPKFRFDPFNTGCYQSGNWSGWQTSAVRRTAPQKSLMAQPNPFRTAIKINLGFAAQKPGGSKTRKLIIYDATGRKVRSFLLPADYSKMTSIVWDGTDQMGRRLAAGVYFIRLASEDGSEIKKIVLIK